MSCFAIVIDSLSGGGAEQVMLRLASAITKQGHTVKFIVIRHLVVHAIPSSIQPLFLLDHYRRKGIKWLYYRRTAQKLQKLLDSVNSDQPITAILSNLPETDRIVRLVKGYRIYYCIHNSFYHSKIGNKKNPIKRWLKTQQLRRIYNAKHLIFVSEGAREDLEQQVGVSPASSNVIYNPFPIGQIHGLATAYPVEQTNYLIHVGRFIQQKRHDRLLKIYAESGIANPLLLLGEGSADQVKKIEELIHQLGLERQVSIAGFKQNPYPYIQNALALLLTSDFEGLPTVIIEALICGTPVIAYDCPSGPKEILTGKLSEYLVPFGNSVAFCEKLKEVTNSPRRITAEMANLSRFEADQIVKQYLNVLSS